MRLILMSLATVMAIAACSEQAPQSSPADDTPTSAPAPTAPVPAPTAPPHSGDGGPAAPAPADACGAAARQDLIGQARADLPSPPPGAQWRIFESGQPVTQDLRPDRLNIEIDPERQTVVRLSCG